MYNGSSDYGNKNKVNKILNKYLSLKQTKKTFHIIQGTRMANTSGEKTPVWEMIYHFPDWCVCVTEKPTPLNVESFATCQEKKIDKKKTHSLKGSEFSSYETELSFVTSQIELLTHFFFIFLKIFGLPTRKVKTKLKIHVTNSGNLFDIKRPSY